MNQIKNVDKYFLELLKLISDNFKDFYGTISYENNTPQYLNINHRGDWYLGDKRFENRISLNLNDLMDEDQAKELIINTIENEIKNPKFPISK